MKITLFLMTKKGYDILSHIINTYSSTIIDKVIAGQDQNVANDYYLDIQTLCERHGVEFHDKNDNFTVTTQYALAISWRWLINCADTTLIVLHDSLLPRYRGFAPLVSSLINKEPRIGVTAIMAGGDYDLGDIIFQSSSQIVYPIKISEAINEIRNNYTEAVNFVLASISSGAEFSRIAQSKTTGSYSLWLDDEDYFIDWLQPAERISRFIDAVGYPYKGAACYLNGSVVRISESVLMEDVKIENRSPGKVIFVEDGMPVVVCGEGLIKITKMTSENGESLIPLEKFRSRFK